MNSNIWRTVALILIGALLGYMVGRFELTTISVTDTDVKKTNVEQEEKKADKYNAIRSAGENADSWLAQQGEVEKAEYYLIKSYEMNPLLVESLHKLAILEFQREDYNIKRDG